MQKVDIFLVLSTRATGKIKKAEYKYILVCNGHSLTGNGTVTDTTGNRLALICTTEALKRMNKASLITIYTDSYYLINGYKNLEARKANGWKRPGGQTVKNADLWQQLHELQKIHAVRYQFEDMEKYR